MTAKLALSANNVIHLFPENHTHTAERQSTTKAPLQAAIVDVMVCATSNLIKSITVNAHNGSAAAARMETPIRRLVLAWSIARSDA
jgi:hypothetical protein